MKKSSFETERSADAARPSPEEIAKLAYNLYHDRGCQPGHEAEDWYNAEQLLTAQINLEMASRRSMATGHKSPR